MGRRTLLTVSIMLGAVVALSACNPSEQGRILEFEKGVYLGKTEAPLSLATLKQLRARAAYQAGSVGGLAGASRVRLPDAELDVNTLRQRGRDQRDYR